MDQTEYELIDNYISNTPLPQEKSKLTSRTTFMCTDDELRAVEALAEELGVPKSVIIRAGLKTAIQHPALMMCNVPNYISPEQMRSLAEAFSEEEDKWPENLVHEALLEKDICMLNSDQYDMLMEVINTNLSSREREVIFLLYRDSLTLDRCGDNYGVTRERIRQVRANAFRKLHKRKDLILNGYRNWIINKADEITDSLYFEVEKRRKKASELTDYWDPKIVELELSVRAYNCMVRAGIERISNLIGFGPRNFISIKNLGRRSAREIADRLFAFNGWDLYEVLSKDEAVNDPAAMTREEFNSALK